MEFSFEKFKMPHLETYSGEGDPSEHVKNYFDIMSMLQVSEAVLYRCFPITLKGSAKLWCKCSGEEIHQQFSTGETPFRLTYGAEAVMPIEVGMPTIWLQHFNKDLNSLGLRVSLDLLEETREKALRTQVINQQRIAQHYNKKIRPRRFMAGDLILRKVTFDKDTWQGKLAPNWEGPYTVTVELRAGTYRLRGPDG
ncbi:uncharacterized protein LOC109846774 [Asparagus officinalis]|uniref:uncharacterized protein LOC109846774 n=1 Tax=Asparagus officinalis TaxID=4686 RepID=UPI00098E35AE|nr:uncharacterized protein LOC109846774 [Asparagus officinalis]